MTGLCSELPFEQDTCLLHSVLKNLLEDAVIVSDAIAVGRHFQRCHGVQEACGQPSKSSVTQSGIRLGLLKFIKIETKLKNKIWQE